MYEIAYLGRWENIPEAAAAICDHDLSRLEALLQGGLDLGVPIQLSEYIKLTPLEIAVFRNDVPMIHFLLEHGANPDLAVEQPLLLTAVRCCGPEVVALFAGQAAKLSLKQKERAFQEVRWGKRAENIPVLEQAGIAVDKFGGEAFRAAVSDGQAELAKLLLEKGADIGIPGSGVRWTGRACQIAAGKRGGHQLPQAGHGVSERLHPSQRGHPLQQFPHGALAC